MSPKKLLVLLGPALLAAPCAGAEGATKTPHAIGGLRPVSSMSSLWDKQGLRREAPPAEGAALRCGALSSQALCTRARGGGVVEKGGGLFAGSGKPVTVSSSSSSGSSSQVSGPANNDLRSHAGNATGDLSNLLSSGAGASPAALPAAAPASGEAGGDVGPDTSERLRKVKSTPSTKRTPAMWEEDTMAVRAALQATAVAAVSRGGGVGGEKMGLAIRGLDPENPQLRGAGVLALAGLGSGVLYGMAKKNLLRSDWLIPFIQPWQVLTAATWAANMAATRSKGRLDGSSSRDSSNGGGGGSGKKKKPPALPPVRFFSPAGWAFAIWGPIFLGEFIFVLFQLLPVDYVRNSWWLSDISPWFASAMLFQSLWCASFRPWARDAGLLWVPALMLGGVAVALGGVHSILTEAWFVRDMDMRQYLLAHVPISLHFGWITCASLVNLNGYFASISKLSDGFKLVASLCTVAAATLLGAVLSYTREDPIFEAVLAWALWAVGSPAGWSSLKGRVDPGAIRLQELTAKAGAVFAMATVCLLTGLFVKNRV